MSALEAQWIDDVEPEDLNDDLPVDGDEIAVREWVDRKLRRIARLRRERAVAVAIVANERARITEYETREIKGTDRAIQFHLDAVEQWMHERLETDPNTLSYRLPSGTVASRKQKPKIEIDPDVIPDLLHKRPDLARQKWELDKVALNEAVAAGEVFDGVSVTVGRVSVTVSTEAFGDVS